MSGVLRARGRRLAMNRGFDAVLAGDPSDMFGRISAFAGNAGKLDTAPHFGGDLRRQRLSPCLQRFGGALERVRLADELLVGLDNGHSLSLTDQRVAIHGAKSNGTVARDASSRHHVAYLRRENGHEKAVRVGRTALREKEKH